MATKYHDYYQTLGVSRTASAEEIQRAFRKLARQYHPDVNKEPGAEKKFKEINEANEVLGDPDKRKRYDALGENWKAGQDFRPPPGSGGGGFRVDFGDGRGGDFSDFFEALFGGGRAGAGRGSPFGGFGGGMGGVDMDDFVRSHGGGDRGGARARQPRARQGHTHEADITISLADAYHGATRQINLQATDEAGDTSSKSFDVRIPPGITEGSVIRLGGQGGPGSHGAPAGDLLLRVHIAPDPNFRIEGDGHDLATTISIAPWEAALGAKVPVQTLSGEIVLTIPAGSQSGQRLRIRGKGLPRRAGGVGGGGGGGAGAHGDLFAELRIVVPKELSAEERSAYEALRDASSTKPRPM